MDRLNLDYISDQEGQVVPDSPYGRELTRWARESGVIVEVGSWRGLGSTLALYRGLHRAEQELHLVDYDGAVVEVLRERYGGDGRVRVHHGRVCTQLARFEPAPEAVRGFANSELYVEEVGLNAEAADVLPELPEEIGLLHLDGGMWTSDGDLQALGPRVRIVALDDAGPNHFKNRRNRERLLAGGWEVLYDEPDERTGVFIARRPAGQD